MVRQLDESHTIAAVRAPLSLRRVVRATLATASFAVRSRPNDMDEKFSTLFESCRPFTLTSVERMYALYQAVEYVVTGGIDGAFVECGVWCGGSSMLAARTFGQLG